ncbi:MAG: IS4 family transposase [bacterium]|nr:MAG: IS4 family transposase [bacterium]
MMDTASPEEKLIRKRIAEIPLLQAVEHRLGLRDILIRYIKPHGNEAVPAVESLLLLVFNIACGRQPLYELDAWIAKLDDGLLNLDWDSLTQAPLSNHPQGIFNDDRFGRALDKLYQADRASMITDVAIRVVQATGVDLSQLHNDSTSVKTTGKMPGKTATGLYFARGHSKDHRPDLKQVVYSLTISADGAIPIHCKAYSGNTTDDTTHIETWNTLRHIAGRPDFLYVADCKVCTDKQLSHIVKHGGRVVTLMPNTWKESEIFKNQQRENPRSKQRILRRLIPNRETQYETFYRIAGEHLTQQRGYTLHWIYSTEKKKRDRLSRANLLKKVEAQLTGLMGKINTRNLKTREQIQRRAHEILESRGVLNFYHLEVGDVKQSEKVQIGKGRPGKDTQYRTKTETIHTLSWTRNIVALNKEKNVDGLFPILCTDKQMSAKEALVAYKYQPNLEKRFYQLKSIHHVAPTLFKKVERVEAILFLFYLALILQAVIEREVRQQMYKKGIEALPLYPEHRLSYHPTTAKIFDQFQDTTVSYLTVNDQLTKEYRDHLGPIQRQILALLKISEADYWRSTDYVKVER